MCGIFAGTNGVQLPKKDCLTHRGPDSFTAWSYKDVDMLFWRLAINGGADGNQPFEHNGKFLIANAEIYNHVELGGNPSHSDCEVILPLIEEHGLFRTCEIMSGDFAFVVSDGVNIWAARDRVGVRPLFYCKYSTGIAFASEMKALIHIGSKVDIFPPGHLYDSKIDKFVCWSPNYWDHPRRDNDVEFVKSHIKHLMTEAVQKRVTNTDRPVGFFLSGGLDSSIIAALGKKALGKIKTFSIGLENSPDLLAARDMAKFLDSEHTEVLFTVEEGLAAIREVIWHTETFDTTTIRASIPMYLLSKYIKKNTDIRVILSGEGSDELFGGYLYFHGAPSIEEFLSETGRLVQDVHMFDVLRADRTTSAHGIELRVPFFDRDVIDYVMDGFDEELKMPRGKWEKYILREAFEDDLPHDICWRQKNGMSDAVGYEWVEALRALGEDKYASIFASYFGKNTHNVPYMWMPKWCKATDPSARTLSYFNLI
jgi:asparagine synthase (glutamine-hydrolysing)